MEILVHKMLDVNLEQIFFKSEKNSKSEKFRYAIALIFKSPKTPFLSTSNSATEWSEAKNFSTKIFTVKNCSRSEVFKLIGNFYYLLSLLFILTIEYY